MTAVVAVLPAPRVVRPALAWDRTPVPAELEGLFPRLGQRVRTAAQHGERPAEELARDGVAPGLVAALEEETAEKAKPLPFQAALPVRPVLVAGAVALICVAALVAVAVWLPEWRAAVTRVALAQTPYTALTATASADAVDEGTDVEILAAVSGRARPAVVLHTREAGDAEWRQETMDPADSGFRTRLPKLLATTEFFVAAGPESTPVRQIVVRHALKIVGTQVEVTSPAYTGVAPVTYDSGSFSAIQGSTAKLRFELDREPVFARLVVKDPAKPKDSPSRPDMKVRGKTVDHVKLEADLEYRRCPRRRGHAAGGQPAPCADHRRPAPVGVDRDARREHGGPHACRSADPDPRPGRLRPYQGRHCLPGQQ